jgi:phage N-6-adenine-methyltransferase
MAKIIKRNAAPADGEPRASDLWRTPPDLFEALHQEFMFDLDLAADAGNNLLPRWLGPGGLAEDAISVNWSDYGHTGFLNPPYSAALIRQFMWAAARAALCHKFTVVTLVPYTPSTKWWQNTRTSVEIRELESRVPYLRSDGVTRAGAMFDSAVVVFRPQPGIIRAQPRRVTWSWRELKPNKPSVVGLD